MKLIQLYTGLCEQGIYDILHILDEKHNKML
jgi:hypothetical protein